MAFAAKALALRSPAFTPHGLRRTGRTGLAKLGVKVDTAERVLNHARERIEATYDVHDYIEEKREALEQWAKYLKDLGGSGRDHRD